MQLRAAVVELPFVGGNAPRADELHGSRCGRGDTPYFPERRVIDRERAGATVLAYGIVVKVVRTGQQKAPVATSRTSGHVVRVEPDHVFTARQQFLDNRETGAAESDHTRSRGDRAG